MKKVFILGGTGFLGYYTLKELLNRGYEVETMALPPMPADDLLPAGVKCELGDINQLTDEEIIAKLSGCYGFIYAAGADERIIPQAPAIKFFYEANVLPTQRLARLAKKAKVEKFVVFGSYFAEFAERLESFNLRNQAYPNTRLLQEQIAFAEGEGSMTVSSLRLPYIFGTMPGRTPLWKMFTDQIKGQEVFPCLGGGTAMVTVQQVAEAAVGAMENGQHRGTYAISGINMSYHEFYQLMVDVLGQKTELPVLPFSQLAEVYQGIDQQAAEAGKEHGIHAAVSAQLQEENLYLDPQDTMPILGYKAYDVRASIIETLQKCVE
ncbi:NAD-dependent epimerase/dehydratase family protein [Vagococcus sp. BWB3-3]|uniref:NAD-dependent epimerase/dehydratase family protein n=1 Tax=Vagococcus allomyrinae TaxID=2794353 RepID=A0A940PHF8_9ENTE|nr:NAD-dependent epimerase/dehydratase family protein [Vagococcus allomyrinae]MBP1043626.1 NAD-dependent epimerase/dehydratase family protein [Vagococcus allomyrinae]